MEWIQKIISNVKYTFYFPFQKLSLFKKKIDSNFTSKNFDLLENEALPFPSLSYFYRVKLLSRSPSIRRVQFKSIASRTILYLESKALESQKKKKKEKKQGPKISRYPLAEILRATSSVYFLPKVVSYATLLESKSRVRFPPQRYSPPFLPSSSSLSVAKQRQECSFGPLLLPSLNGMADQRRRCDIFESAKKKKKIMQRNGERPPPFIGRVISKRDAE